MSWVVPGHPSATSLIPHLDLGPKGLHSHGTQESVTRSTSSRDVHFLMRFVLSKAQKL